MERVEMMKAMNIITKHNLILIVLLNGTFYRRLF